MEIVHIFPQANLTTESLQSVFNWYCLHMKLPIQHLSLSAKVNEHTKNALYTLKGISQAEAASNSEKSTLYPYSLYQVTLV